MTINCKVLRSKMYDFHNLNPIILLCKVCVCVCVYMCVCVRAHFSARWWLLFRHTCHVLDGSSLSLNIVTCLGSPGRPIPAIGRCYGQSLADGSQMFDKVFCDVFQR